MQSINDEKDPFELELKARLDIDPSPGLQSRIRTRAFAAPERRISWFTLTAGFATAAIAVTFAVIAIQHQPSTGKPSQPVVRNTVAPPSPEPIAVAVQEAAVPRKSKPAVIPVAKKPIAPAFTVVLSQSDRIELDPLTELELTDATPPLPQTSILSVARLEPISLEPLALTVRTLGVNE